MPRRSLYLILATAIISYVCYQRADRNPYGRYFAEVLQHVDRSYVERVDEQKLFEGAVEGMLSRLDDYSAFIPRTEAQHFQEQLDQEFGGIGLELGVDGKSRQIMVVSPLVGTPAYKAGIRAGDRIVAINGESSRAMPLKDALEKLRGKPKTQVKLSIERDDEEDPLEFELTRDIIQVDSVLGGSRRPDGSWNYLISEKEKIGYLRVTSFGDPTYKQLVAALDTLQKAGMRGLILDLRNNPGGLLESGTKVCDLFLKEKEVPIVSICGRDGDVREAFNSSGNGRFTDFPMVVLVNHYSASASEIVAACLQDHHRAEVAGERSWGKGTVQNVIYVEGGRSVLKLTTASYWRPSGKNIHRFKESKEDDDWGVTPDPGLDVKLDDEAFSRWIEFRRNRDLAKPGADWPGGDLADADPQLAKALEYLETKLSNSPASKTAAVERP